MNRRLSEKDKFYSSVGEAMSMSEMRSFINMETLDVDFHASEDYFSFEDEVDTAQEALDNPDKYFAIDTIESRKSFQIMEDFVHVVKDISLQKKLIEALSLKRPFANFKHVIDSSNERENWFEFKRQAHAAIAKEWLDLNADEKLLETIKNLSSVCKVE